MVFHFASPVFDGANDDDVWSTIEEAGMARDGKSVLYDGRTGEPFDNRILSRCNVHVETCAHG